MTRFAKVLMVLALGAVICLPGMAMADFLMSDVSGWHWTDPGLYPNQNDPNFKYDAFNTYITGGAETFSNAFVGTDKATVLFNLGSWTGTYVSPTASHAQGPEQGLGQTLQWNYNFVDIAPPATVFPYSIKIDYFDKGNYLGYEHYTINGGDAQGGFTPVPLPPSMLLMGSGLVGLVGLRGRRRKTSV
jgi:hypothetical protein